MDLQSYLEVLKRRWYVIVLVAIASVAAAIASRALRSPIHVSTATVRVVLDAGVAELRPGEAYNTRLLNTYRGVVQSELIIKKTIETLAVPMTVDELRGNTTVTVVPDTELISISVQDADPVRARDLANSLANQLTAYVQGLYGGSTKSTRQILQDQLVAMENDLNVDRQKQADLLARGVTGGEVDALARTITVKEAAYNRLLTSYETARLNESLRANSVALISPATIPKTPPNVPNPMDAGLALIVGLFGGMGLVSALEKVTTRIHSAQQAELLTDFPVLATVSPGLMSANHVRNANGEGRSDRISESYRLLSVNVSALQREHSTKTILITSPAAIQAKSMVATNLARALAELGHTTFLVEGDLRYPAIDRLFSSPNGYSLGGMLSRQGSYYRSALDALPPLIEQPNLFVVGGGPQPANPAATLASPTMNGVIDYLRDHAAIALVDSPPVLMAADASVLGSKVDGVILVLRQSSTKRNHLLAAIKQLRAGGAHVLGFVFVRTQR